MTSNKHLDHLNSEPLMFTLRIVIGMFMVGLFVGYVIGSLLG